MIYDNYYPEDGDYKEVNIKFCGYRNKPLDVMCYLKLKSLTKKLDMDYPEFRICCEFNAYGCLVWYSCDTILENNKDNTKKMNKIKKICDELMKYGIKTQSIPMVEVWHFGEKTSHLNLEEYLNTKGIRLENLVLGEVLSEKSLEESR